MKKFIPVLIVISLVLVACAAGPNELIDKANSVGNVAGFWRGLWHGLICPFTFIISLFCDSVNVYEVHNSGGWYNFGFVLGLGSSIGGGSSARRRKS